MLWNRSSVSKMEKNFLRLIVFVVEIKHSYLLHADKLTISSTNPFNKAKTIKTVGNR